MYGAARTQARIQVKQMMIRVLDLLWIFCDDHGCTKAQYLQAETETIRLDWASSTWKKFLKLQKKTAGTCHATLFTLCNKNKRHFCAHLMSLKITKLPTKMASFGRAQHLGRGTEQVIVDFSPSCPKYWICTWKEKEKLDNHFVELWLQELFFQRAAQLWAYISIFADDCVSPVQILLKKLNLQFSCLVWLFLASLLGWLLLFKKR